MLFVVFAVCGLLANACLASADPRAPIHYYDVASLTAPIPSTSTSVSSSSGGSSTSDTTALSTRVATLLTTSVGSDGTSTFSTTLTSVISNASGVATGTLTTTSFPSLSTYSPCVTNCLTLAVSQVNCSTITDVSCFCANGNFPLDLVGCVSSQCSDQLSSAESLARQFCNLASPTASLTFPPSPSNSTSSISTTSTSTSTQSSTPTSNSSTSLLPFGLLSAYNIFVTIMLGFLAVVAV